ncbi:MAG: metallo-mystery pair system four-Cys motif protein [Terriglobia bacterium]
MKFIFTFAILATFVDTCLLITFSQSEVPVSIHFRAMVGDETLGCGRSYEGVGLTKVKITLRDFRFYVHDLRLIDETGKEFLISLEQDGKWQFERVALLDFENGMGSCGNGTVDLNDRVTGSIPTAGRWRGLRFTLGVPFELNHTDLLSMPSPLNLTAMSWVWNAGRKFARLEFSSPEIPQGFAIHLGSTGCKPNDTSITIPTQCSEPNRAEIYLPEFNPVTDLVVADLGALLSDSKLCKKMDQPFRSCMSNPDDPECGPIFANLGLPFPGQQQKEQRFFRVLHPRADSAEGGTR